MKNILLILHCRDLGIWRHDVIGPPPILAYDHKYIIIKDLGFSVSKAMEEIYSLSRDSASMFSFLWYLLVLTWATCRCPESPTPLRGLCCEGGYYAFHSLLTLYYVVICMFCEKQWESVCGQFIAYDTLKNQGNIPIQGIVCNFMENNDFVSFDYIWLIKTIKYEIFCTTRW